MKAVMIFWVSQIFALKLWPKTVLIKCRDDNVTNASIMLASIKFICSSECFDGQLM